LLTIHAAVRRREKPRKEPGLTLPSQYLRHIAEQIRDQGANVGHWLGQSGLTEAQLDVASITIPFSVFSQLIRSAELLAGEPALGLFVGRRLVAHSHGIVGYAALHSATVRQALDLFARFVQLRFSLLAISHEERGHKVRVVFKQTYPLGDMQRPLLEAVVLSVKNVLDSISMGACKVNGVAFPFAKPQYASVAQDLFQCEVRYGQPWAGFTLPRAVLDEPLKQADADAFRQAALVCQRELDKLAANDSVAGRVRRLLLEQQNGLPSLQLTARVFRLTPRTLHRRLVSEGTSFRELTEEIRHTLAVEHLKAGHFSIEEVAYTLGYSDLANFRRAFKRWEGVAPSEYRARR